MRGDVARRSSLSMLALVVALVVAVALLVGDVVLSSFGELEERLETEVLGDQVERTPETAP